MVLRLKVDNVEQLNLGPYINAPVGPHARQEQQLNLITTTAQRDKRGRPVSLGTVTDSRCRSRR